MVSSSQKYKRAVFVIIFLSIILTGFSIVRLVIALNNVRLPSPVQEVNRQEKTSEILFWGNGEARKLQKEIFWVEQQLELSKSDSISLGINLADNVVQVQLKGTTLYRSMILKKSPVDFMQFLDEGYYRNFAGYSNIDREMCNIPKKPVKKIKAPKSEPDARLVSQDVYTEPPVLWNFETGNNLRIVVFGVQESADTSFAIQDKKDLLPILVQEFLHNQLPEKYTPVLYLWLKDTEAKTIYRAIPEKGKVVFRN